MFNAKMCTFPWTELQLNYDGTYGLCCYHVPFIRNTDRLNELWNSDSAKNLRDNIKNYDTKNSICHRCSMHKMDKQFSPFESFYNEQPVTARDNIVRAREEFEKRSLSLSSYPLRLYINFGLQCNLACRMCSQMNLRKQHPETFDAGVLYNQIDFFVHLSEITIIGGEPFLLKPALDFLNFCAGHDVLKRIRFTIITNGTLIDKHIDLLSKFDNLSLWFSIDSYGEHYENIRIGADWNKVSSNIKMYNEIAKIRPGWSKASLSCILMKSGLPGLYDLCRYCIENEYDLNFARVFHCGAPEIANENIFDFHHLLDAYPEWKKIFKESINLLQSSGYHNAADRLIYYFSCLPEKKQKQRDLIVFGTGSYAVQQYNFIEYYNIVAFADNDEKKWGGEFLGHKIIPPAEIKNFPNITICIASMHYENILTQILDENLTTGEIFRIVELERSAPWKELTEAIVPYYPEGEGNA